MKKSYTYICINKISDKSDITKKKKIIILKHTKKNYLIIFKG